jgi:hypothetical protein
MINLGSAGDDRNPVTEAVTPEGVNAPARTTGAVAGDMGHPRDHGFARIFPKGWAAPPMSFSCRDEAWRDGCSC